MAIGLRSGHNFSCGPAARFKSVSNFQNLRPLSSAARAASPRKKNYFVMWKMRFAHFPHHKIIQASACGARLISYVVWHTTYEIF